MQIRQCYSASSSRAQILSVRFKLDFSSVKLLMDLHFLAVSLILKIALIQMILSLQDLVSKQLQPSLLFKQNLLLLHKLLYNKKAQLKPIFFYRHSRQNPNKSNQRLHPSRDMFPITIVLFTEQVQSQLLTPIRFR
jgi:hypothetical protein